MRTTPTVTTAGCGNQTVSNARGGKGRLVNTAASAGVFGQPVAGIQLPGVFHSTSLSM